MNRIKERVLEQIKQNNKAYEEEQEWEDKLEATYDSSLDYAWWTLTPEERQYYVKGYRQALKDFKIGDGK